MSTSAIVMMVLSLAVIWGGLVVAVLRLPEDKSKQQD
ncbi:MULTISPECIES: methionine/alanine import family NSS transporter small subunit [Eikenella]|nr:MULTISPECIES: methionine/alanine import family NSS transporter small subunit [Eikenella]